MTLLVSGYFYELTAEFLLFGPSLVFQARVEEREARERLEEMQKDGFGAIQKVKRVGEANEAFEEKSEILEDGKAEKGLRKSRSNFRIKKKRSSRGFVRQNSRKRSSKPNPKIIGQGGLGGIMTVGGGSRAPGKLLPLTVDPGIPKNSILGKNFNEDFLTQMTQKLGKVKPPSRNKSIKSLNSLASSTLSTKSSFPGDKKNSKTSNFFEISFNLFNLITTSEQTTLLANHQIIENLLTRWLQSAEKIILEDFEIGGESSKRFAQTLPTMLNQVHTLQREQRGTKFEPIFTKLSKIAKFNKKCFELHITLKTITKLQRQIEGVMLMEDPLNSPNLVTRLDFLLDEFEACIDRMSFTTSFKQSVALYKALQKVDFGVSGKNFGDTEEPRPGNPEVVQRPPGDAQSCNEVLVLVIQQFFGSISKKAFKVFCESKLSLRLAVNPGNHELLTRHCNYWVKVSKTNLAYLAGLSKRLTSKVIKRASVRSLKPVRVLLMKIIEYSNLILKIVEIWDNLGEKRTRKVKKVVASIPKGINLLEERQTTLWDTVIVRFFKIFNDSVFC